MCVFFEFLRKNQAAGVWVTTCLMFWLQPVGFLLDVQDSLRTGPTEYAKKTHTNWLWKTQWPVNISFNQSIYVQCFILQDFLTTTEQGLWWLHCYTPNLLAMCWVAFFEINQLISCSSLCSYMCVGVGVVVGVVVVDDVDVVVVMKTSDCLSHGYGSKLGTQKWRAPRHMFTANHWFNPSQSIILLMNVIRPYQNHHFHLTSFKTSYPLVN